MDDIPSDSDISGASDDSFDDETYMPPSLMPHPPLDLEDELEDELEEEELIEEDEDVQEGAFDVPGPSGDVPNDPREPLLPSNVPAKRRRISGKKAITRDWTEDDLPPQEMPVNEIKPKNVDDCDRDVKYFLKMFGNNNIQLLTVQSNIQRAQEAIRKNRNIPPFTEREIRQSIGILMYMSIVSLPNIKQYWRLSLRNEMVAGVMTRDRFEQIVSFFHLSDNNLQPGRDSPDYDRLYKVPVIFLYYKCSTGTSKIKNDQKTFFHQFLPVQCKNKKGGRI